MNVNLYTCGDSPIKINKTLSNELTIEGVKFKDDNNLEMVNPSLLFNLGSNIADITKYNYARIPQFGRYYFITRWSTEGALIRLDCHCDVLNSFKNDILNSTQYISRQCNSDSLYNMSRYYVDDMLPMISKKQYIVKQFGVSVDDRTCNHLILETIGKGGTGV